MTEVKAWEEIVLKVNSLDELVHLILDEEKIRAADKSCIDTDGITKIKSLSIIYGNVKMHPSVMMRAGYVLNLDFHHPFEIELNPTDIDSIIEKYGLKQDIHVLLPQHYSYDIFTTKKKMFMLVKDEEIISLGKHTMGLDFTNKATKKVFKDILNYYLTKGKIK